jgi:hypothetical protein
LIVSARRELSIRAPEPGMSRTAMRAERIADGRNRQPSLLDGMRGDHVTP